VSRQPKKNAPRLGAHCSTSGGLPTAIERAVELESTALQLFVKSARQWSARPIDPADVAAFREAAERTGLAPYTALWNRSIDAFGVELERCAQLGVPYLVIHPGSHVGSGEAKGLDRVARALKKLLGGARGKRSAGVTVLLEITAGQGTNLGARFEHLGTIIEKSGVEQRLGACFDTCHALAAGYDFRDRSGYRETFDALDDAVGLDRLQAFHLNDSKHELGSRRDRHEQIGEGCVGLEAFRLLMNDARFRGRPMVLETPKGEDMAEDRVNLAKLRAMVGTRRAVAAR
jgi:deoxyribonuclease-4